MKLRVAVLLLCLAVAVPASAGTLTLVTNRTLLPSDDLVKWGNLGGDMTPLASPFNTTSQGGAAVTVSGASAFGLFSGSTFNADFAPTDTVLSLFDLGTLDPLSGLLRLRFDRPFWGVGADIQSNLFGGFTAFLTALDSTGTAMGPAVSVAGANGGSGADCGGCAPFLGVRSSAKDIWGVEFSLDGDPAGFGINDVSLSITPPVTHVPEPAGTLGLMLLGAGVLGAIRRRSR
jgi:hypothetical protein